MMHHTHPTHHHHMQVSMHPQIHPQQSQQQQPPPPPPHLPHQHMTNVPPPNVTQPPNQPHNHNMQREHHGNRINNHHHHQRLGGHQMQPHITIQQNPRKAPHNGMVIGNMPPHQQQPHHQIPSKQLPLSGVTQQPQIQSLVPTNAITPTQILKASHPNHPTSNVSTNTSIPVVSAATTTILSSTNKQTQRIIQNLDNKNTQNTFTSVPTTAVTSITIAQPDTSTVIVSDSNVKEQSQQILSPIDTLANIKEKTPMCLVNELARYNKIQHQYRLTGETGPAHKKRFTVTLKLGDEEYTSDGASIKKAQHTAAHEAISKTKYKHPPAKTNRMIRSGNKINTGVAGNITPTVELNALAMKRGEPTIYETEPPVQSAVGLRSVLNGSSVNPAMPPPAAHLSHHFIPQHPNAHYGNYHHRNTPNVYATPSQSARFGSYERRQGGRGVAVKDYQPRKMNYYDLSVQSSAANQSSRKINYYDFPLQSSSIINQEIYKVTLHVGERIFLGEGNTLQAARHDAAARALEVLKPLTPDSATASVIADTSIDTDDPNSELKSPISLVHEMALKRKLSVIFEVQSEKGPPHMKMFVTLCKVGSVVTEGEGNGKKLSKKRAAEKMMDELKKLPPPSPEINPKSSVKQRRRGAPVVKKKTRNLIKEKTEPEFSEEVNPISRLMQIQQARKEKEPCYNLLEERGVARRREFIIEVSASGTTAVGTGPNKKVAKKVAAENLLSAIGLAKVPLVTSNPVEVVEKPRKVTFEEPETLPVSTPAPTFPGGSSGRQIVPGVIFMSVPTSKKPVGLSEASSKSGISPQQTATIAQELLNEGTSPTAEAITNASSSNTPTSISGVTPTAPSINAPTGESGRITDQLMYLAQLLKFTVDFSDFPKGNHGEFLTLVTLSTEPPQLCHGSGSSLEESHDEASRGALEMLSKIGLDNVKSKSKQHPPSPSSPDDSKLKPILMNGVKK